MAHSTHNRRGDARPNYIVVGTDAHGSDHVYRTIDETVHVVTDDGDREHVADVSERGINAWMDFVAVDRGWTTRNLYRDLGEQVAAHAEVA